MIGGVKERPIAYKLGVAFCDHNHERKIALAGFEGLVNFAREVHASVMSPVWQFVPRRDARHKARLDDFTQFIRGAETGCSSLGCASCKSACSSRKAG
jgi:hypothetical protein